MRSDTFLRREKRIYIERERERVETSKMRGEENRILWRGRSE